MRAQHSNTHSRVMWNVGIQSNVMDNTKCKATSLLAISVIVEKINFARRDAARTSSPNTCT